MSLVLTPENLSYVTFYPMDLTPYIVVQTSDFTLINKSTLMTLTASFEDYPDGEPVTTTFNVNIVCQVINFAWVKYPESMTYFIGTGDGLME